MKPEFLKLAKKTHSTQKHIEKPKIPALMSKVNAEDELSGFPMPVYPEMNGLKNQQEEI